MGVDSNFRPYDPSLINEKKNKKILDYFISDLIIFSCYVGFYFYFIFTE